MDLGQHFTITEDIYEQCERFVCALYGYNCDSVNEVRYKMFCKNNAQSHRRPPSKDALKKHILRANYQAAIWRRSLQPVADIPSPPIT